MLTFLFVAPVIVLMGIMATAWFLRKNDTARLIIVAVGFVWAGIMGYLGYYFRDLRSLHDTAMAVMLFKFYFLGGFLGGIIIVCGTPIFGWCRRMTQRQGS